MKRRIPTRIFSLFLAFVLLVSSCPTVYAVESVDLTEPDQEMTEPAETEASVETEETTAPSEETQTTAVTEASEETAPAEETESTVATEPSEETEATEETEPAEETVPEETEATVETEPAEETVPEETEAAQLPYGLTGMPEDYLVSEEALEEKQTQIDIGFLDALAALTPGEDYVEDEVLAYAESEEEAAMMAAAFNGELLEYFDGFVLIRLADCTVLEAVTASLDLTWNFPLVSPNYYHEIDAIDAEMGTEFNALPTEMDWSAWVQENMSNPDTYLKDPRWNYQWMHDVVDTYAAWGVTTGESWVRVGLVDSGVDTTHADLSSRITGVDIGYGTGDYVGHGTHLAGIIAATMNNGIGGAGIAPGVSVRSYRTVSGTSANPTSAARIKGINRAISDSVHIINISITSPEYNAAEQTAIKRAVANGITVVAAVGNNGSNTKLYPAAMDGVITVAATTQGNNRAPYSNYGSWVDISAPGDYIISTATGGGYVAKNGSSMSAAVVTGVAALYTSARGTRIDPAEMESILKKSATKISASGMGKGIVNAANMLDDKPAAPYLVVEDESGNTYKSGSTVPCESFIYFFESEDSFLSGNRADQRGVVVYTTDGKTPSVKNGVVVNGTTIKDWYGISLSQFAGTTVTIKAAFLSGMGLMGKVATVKVKVAESTNISNITINGSAKLIAGKSCTYKATVAPVATADQDVTWEIYYRSSTALNGVKINAKTGKLTTTAGKTGYVRIRARSKVDSSTYANFRVDIVNVNPVHKITLNYSGLKNPYTLVGLSDKLFITSMVDKYGANIDPTISGVRWTSSNPKVATIDSNGAFTALSKGTTTFTCLSLDGSGKTAKVTLTVKQPVEDMVITGNRSIAPGSSATFKATVYPSNANNKKVTWALSGNVPVGVTINSTTGKVTVPSYVKTSSSSYFYVRAYAKDRPTVTDNYYESYQVYILNKCSGVSIGVNSSVSMGKAPGAQYSSGKLKSVNLFSVNLPDSAGADNSATLKAYSTGSSIYVEWSSSNPSVASVSSSGVVTAHKAGTATITLKALDGSNKKATCTVKVMNPVSSISIETKSPRMSYSNIPAITVGKSVKNTAVFADTYGVPSNKKVEWSFEAYDVNSSGTVLRDWTSFFKNNKLITVSNGTLTVKSAVKNYLNQMSGELQVVVWAYTTDGTGLGYGQSYWVLPATTTLSLKGNYTTAPALRQVTVDFYSNQYNPFGDNWDHAFTATSSNPSVASVAYINGTSTEGKYQLVFYTYKKGTAKITIKTADGSNKSASFTVKVY